METSASRRALRLLRSDPLPPVPRSADLLNASSPRRPGELHESLTLSGEAARHLGVRAAQAGVSVDVAASLVLEAGLLLERRPHLSDVAAGEDPPAIALPEASARYLRSLTVARTPLRRIPSKQRVVAVPVRLVPRLGACDVGGAIETVDLELAISWETAAILSGQTMSEWAVESLLERS
jgi:plasmid stability protein